MKMILSVVKVKLRLLLKALLPRLCFILQGFLCVDFIVWRTEQPKYYNLLLCLGFIVLEGMGYFVITNEYTKYATCSIFLQKSWLSHSAEKKFQNFSLKFLQQVFICLWLLSQKSPALIHPFTETFLRTDNISRTIEL